MPKKVRRVLHEEALPRSYRLLTKQAALDELKQSERDFVNRAKREIDFTAHDVAAAAIATRRVDEELAAFNQRREAKGLPPLSEDEVFQRRRLRFPEPPKAKAKRR